jgi:acetyltransferase-like isoleucine patch superfamily enzyme
MGVGTFINREVFLDGVGVSLGRNVYLAPRAMIVTAAHPIGGPELRAAPGAAQAVRIEDGSWIGAGAIILPGVTIGTGCVIAAGAVVNKNCEPNGLYAGVPARRVKDLPTEPEPTR